MNWPPTNTVWTEALTEYKYWTLSPGRDQVVFLNSGEIYLELYPLKLF